jgi:glutamine amidotransferase
MDHNIIILDYNAGNIQSVKKKVERLGATVTVTNDPRLVMSATKIIMPGVGHFSNAMEHLKNLQLIDALNEAVLVRKTPILGICLGMQLMAKHSEEGDCNGLGWVNGTIKRFNVSNTLHFKVPHMGWNTIHIAKQSSLMAGIDEDAAFYFVHSYHFETADTSIILNETTYDYKFVSAFEQENIFGVQYHPEKSHDVGEQLISNFLKL